MRCFLCLEPDPGMVAESSTTGNLRPVCGPCAGVLPPRSWASRDPSPEDLALMAALEVMES